MDRHCCAGFWIACLAGRTVVQTEGSESANFHAIPVDKCCMDRVENFRDCNLGILLHEFRKAFGKQDDEFGAGHADILR